MADATQEQDNIVVVGFSEDFDIVLTAMDAIIAMHLGAEEDGIIYDLDGVACLKINKNTAEERDIEIVPTGAKYSLIRNL